MLLPRQKHAIEETLYNHSGGGSLSWLSFFHLYACWINCTSQHKEFACSDKAFINWVSYYEQALLSLSGAAQDPPVDFRISKSSKDSSHDLTMKDYSGYKRFRYSVPLTLEQWDIEITKGSDSRFNCSSSCNQIASRLKQATSTCFMDHHHHHQQRRNSSSNRYSQDISSHEQLFWGKQKMLTQRLPIRSGDLNIWKARSTQMRGRDERSYGCIRSSCQAILSSPKRTSKTSWKCGLEDLLPLWIGRW